VAWSGTRALAEARRRLTTAVRTIYQGQLAAYVTDDLVHMVGSQHPADDLRNWSTLEAILDSNEILAGGHVQGAVVMERRPGGIPLSSNQRYIPSMSCFADTPHDQLGTGVKGGSAAWA
jgi:hypothetical protein